MSTKSTPQNTSNEALTSDLPNIENSVSEQQIAVNNAQVDLIQIDGIEYKAIENRKQNCSLYSVSFKLEVLTAYAKGNSTVKELTQQYGVSQPTINRWISEYNRNNGFVNKATKQRNNTHHPNGQQRTSSSAVGRAMLKAVTKGTKEEFWQQLEKGIPVPKAARALNITKTTSYRWRAEFLEAKEAASLSSTNQAELAYKDQVLELFIKTMEAAKATQDPKKLEDCIKQINNLKTADNESDKKLHDALKELGSMANSIAENQITERSVEIFNTVKKPIKDVK